MAFTSGNRTTFTNNADHVLDLKDGLDYLEAKHKLRFLKRLGTNGFVAKAKKHQWDETELATTSEPITLATAATDPTVADAYIYQVNDLIYIGSEIMRVTAIADATTLTVVRGYGDTSDPGTNYTAETAYLLGSADPENSNAPAGQADAPARKFNYVQTFTRAVDLSNDEIAEAHTEGNPLVGNVKRRFVEVMQQFAQAVFYGQRYLDTSNNIGSMGGLDFFITTNPTDASGALSIALIDAEIKQIVDNGGDVTCLVMNTDQKQALDALDASYKRIGQREGTGGNPDIQTWQSGVLDHTVDIVLDGSVKADEIWILNENDLAIGYLSNNGVNGAWHVEDASTPGKDGTKRVIRGKYTLEVGNEKGHSRLYGLT